MKKVQIVQLGHHFVVEVRIQNSGDIAEVDKGVAGGKACGMD